MIQPVLFHFGWLRYEAEAFDGVEWFLLGVVEVLVLALVLGLAERRFALEAITDRRAVAVDVIYTLLHRLGAIGLLAFALLTPVIDFVETALRSQGVSRPNLDQLVPGVTDLPWVSVAIYLVVLDFVDYWLHRGQHRFAWWWALHAVHHSQRQLTFWSDDRNHLLDDLIRDAVMAFVALAIGVAPAQFVLLTVLTRVLQSLQHANFRLGFGPLLSRILVDPIFHRRHHAIDVGADGAGDGNFGVLFSIWDQIFGTAQFERSSLPTGIRDQLDGRDYGRGFWRQQVLGLQRMFGRAQARGIGPRRIIAR
ncbi:MAG: sterol desaturase family protein [Burkholderiaceae bacterium]